MQQIILSYFQKRNKIMNLLAFNQDFNRYNRTYVSYQFLSLSSIFIATKNLGPGSYFQKDQDKKDVNEIL